MTTALVPTQSTHPVALAGPAEVAAAQRLRQVSGRPVSEPVFGTGDFCPLPDIADVDPRVQRQLTGGAR